MNRVFIIAEAGVNHNGRLELAFDLIDQAVEAGADAVKFQTYKTENLVTRQAKKADYQTKNVPDADDSQYQMLKSLELSHQQFLEIKKYCDQKSIIFLSTPFDEESADFLNDLVDVFKISSGDCTHYPFLEKIAQKGKPVILSTGMATLEEISIAVDVFKKYPLSLNSKTIFPPLTLLHCTSNYPCPMQEVNLRALSTLREHFQIPIGYSDHTEGILIPVAATVLGANIIEKHFTLDRNLPGPDHKASLNPQELKEMVRAIRQVEIALGDGVKKPQASELKTREAARRSLIVSRDLPAGAFLEEKDLTLKRPGTGLAADQICQVIGKKLKRAVCKDEILSWEMLERGV